ncbi:MAG TPA: AAA family ATPase, partial [Polyangiales bacterium]
LWAHEPPPASEVVREMKRERLEPPPAGFDELLGVLLCADRDERIASTSELIDRLNVLAELQPEAAELAVSGYLGSSAFVGREPERQRIARAIAAARGGNGEVLVVEGAPGVGRSRFLREVALSAKLDGVTAISGGPHTRTRAYGLAAQLLDQLSRALPGETRAAVSAHEQALEPVRALSTPLREARSTIQAAGDQRARLQNALLTTFCEVASAQPIVLLVDDLDQADEESSAFIAALCHRASQLRLCLVLSLPKPLVTPPAAAVTSLLSVAELLTLPPLSGDQTHTLLRSVFGEVPYLARLTERLQRCAEGNPSHCLELAQHLVQTGEARYVEGSWSLPNELGMDALPPSRPAGMLLRLERLSPAASALARAMSVSHRGPWTTELAADAAAIPLDEAETLIVALVRERVLRRSESGYAFDHDVLSKRLQAGLEPAQQREIHRRLGIGMRRRSSPDDVAARLGGCTHFLHAGDLRRAYPMLRQALAQCVEGDPAHIGLHAAAFEEIHALLRAAQQDDHALAGPLAMLAVAGYFADRRYALRYGAEAAATLERVLKLSWAHALAPWLGRKLALFVALLAAAVRCWWRRARSTSVEHNVRGLLLAASTLAGTAAICMDPDRAARYAKYLEPFTALGPDHAASVVHDFTALMSLQGRDRTARCVAEYQTMLRRLDKERPIRDMTDVVRSSYYAGVHLTLGVFLVRRDDREGLALADKLEQFSPLYAMGADHLRSNYWAGRGDLEHAQYWRRRMEIHAIQLGTAWQVETWAPVDVINVAMRLHDATAMKRAMDELAHVCTKVPSLAVQHRYARIGYLVLSGQYHEALALGAECNEPPYSHNGWMRTQGTLARAYNALGRHAEARELCLAAMRDADADEFDYVVPNLGMQIELALAEAGLGDFREARRQLQRLTDKHTANECPVTLGSLFEARARVAIMEKDSATAKQHLTRAEELVAPLGVASLTRRIRALAREIGRTGHDASTFQTLAPPGPEPDVGSRTQLNLRARGAITDRVCRSLEILRGLCGAKQICLLLRDESGARPRLMHTGDTPPPKEVVRWTEAKLGAFDGDDDGSTALTKAFSDRSAAHQKLFGSTYYRSRALWLPNRHATAPFAILVLASATEASELPEPETLRALVSHLMTVGKG